jgi:hypothetical protein
VTFASQEALDVARKAAEQQRPVELGSALHTYLEQCIQQLTPSSPAESGGASSNVKSVTPARVEGTVAPRLVDLGEGRFSLCVEEFEAFGDAEDREQELGVTGYSLEAAVKRHLKRERSPHAAELKFDCESSMFSVTSSNLTALAHVAEVLFRFVTDAGLRRKLIRYDDS